MNMKQAFFEFSSYRLKGKEVFFYYKQEFKNSPAIFFTEKIILSKAPDYKNYSRKTLDELLSRVHIMLGISYYKLYCSPKVKLNKNISGEEAEFWNTVYRKGLGEFLFKNDIDPKKIAKFPYVNKNLNTPESLNFKSRSLVGIGGGKDSIVSAELLKQAKFEISAFVLRTNKGSAIIDKVIETLKINKISIRREIDGKLFGNLPDAYNGHIPISAIIAFLGVLAAVVSGYKNVIVSNEHSSSFGNIEYKGEMINHQWSKSSEFEIMFSEFLKKYVVRGIYYFSIFRPISEIRIMKEFINFPKYFNYFSSCNRNFTVFKERQEHLWCGECPKCAFVFAMMSAYLSKKEVITIFGKNLFNDPSLVSTYKDLLGMGKMKPFDCVGTFEETQAAFVLASNRFKNSIVMKALLSKIKISKVEIQRLFETTVSQNIPPEFRFIGMHSALILGYDVEGKASEKFLKKFFPSLKLGIADQILNPGYLEEQYGYDLVLKTPGIPKEKVKVQYTTGTNIFFSKIKGTIIGVTGTKGKSTVSSLIYNILKEAEKKVQLVGNIGMPMLGQISGKQNEDTIFVVELSSYQLDDLFYSPQIAVVLNLYPEHLNYHDTLEKYFNAKMNITNNQGNDDRFFFNSSDKLLEKWSKETLSKSSDFAQVKIPKNIRISLLGEHNKNNIRAALSVVKTFKVPDSTIKRAIEKFETLPHRLESLGEHKGIKFINDSISTIPQSAIAAIDALGKNLETIIVGGFDRGVDYLPLVMKIFATDNIKNIILLPTSGRKIKKISQSLKGYGKKKFFSVKDMREAVELSYKKTSEEKIVLLSPASPSFGMFKNYKERGEHFRREVEKF